VKPKATCHTARQASINNLNSWRGTRRITDLLQKDNSASTKIFGGFCSS